MKLICVSFNENNHYELHTSLFEKAQEEFKKEKIIDKGVYPQEINCLNYYPMVSEDIYLYINKNSTVYLKFNLYEFPTDNCGYLEVFENNKLIYVDTLYPYYPKS